MKRVGLTLLAQSVAFLPLSAQVTSPALSARLSIALADSGGACIQLADSVARRHPVVTLLWPPATQVGGPKAVALEGRVGEHRSDCPRLDIEGYVSAVA